MSMGTSGAEDAPTTTGSVALPVEVQRPLPPTLAYSDATKIGQAAAAAVWQAEANGTGEWVNAATGSSGTVEEGPGDSAGECRPFSTIVTSIGGVHQYSGDICRADDGKSVLRIGASIGEENI
jgi:hypothetical protein